MLPVLAVLSMLRNGAVVWPKPKMVRLAAAARPRSRAQVVRVRWHFWPFSRPEAPRFRAGYDLYAETETLRRARQFSYPIRVCLSARFDV
jgi:hypothetical protein